MGEELTETMVFLHERDRSIYIGIAFAKRES